MRLKPRFVTLTSVAVGFAKVNFAREPTACPCTRATLFGESVASETLRPLPVPAVVPVVVVVVVVVLDDPPPRLNAAREMEPKYPTAGAMFLDDCHEATAVRVWVPKYPVAPAAIPKPPPIRAFWRQVTSAPVEPIVRLRENEQAEVPVVVVV